MNPREDVLNPRKGWQPPQPRFWPLVRRSGLSRHLLASLPALLAIATVFVLASASAMTDPGPLRAHYFQEAVRHFQARDYEAARVGFGMSVEGTGHTPQDSAAQVNTGPNTGASAFDASASAG